MTDQDRQRPSPREATSGSPQRPPEQLAAPALAFPLAAEAERLRQEESWQQSDRNARTLTKESGLRLTLVALKAGARLEEHATPGALTIQTLAGQLRLTIAGEVSELPANHLVALEPNVPHAVEALEESTFLLTLAMPLGRREPLDTP